MLTSVSITSPPQEMDSAAKWTGAGLKLKILVYAGKVWNISEIFQNEWKYFFHEKKKKLFFSHLNEPFTSSAPQERQCHHLNILH